MHVLERYDSTRHLAGRTAVLRVADRGSNKGEDWTMEKLKIAFIGTGSRTRP
jgi:hypothetical protein